MYDLKLLEFNKGQKWQETTQKIVWEALDYSKTLLDYGSGMGIPSTVIGPTASNRVICYEPNKDLAYKSSMRTMKRVYTSHNDLRASDDLNLCNAVLLNHSYAHIRDLDQMFLFFRTAFPRPLKIFVVTPNERFYQFRRPFMTPVQYASDPTVVRPVTRRSLISDFERWGFRTLSVDYAWDKAFKFAPDFTRARLIGRFLLED